MAEYSSERAAAFVTAIKLGAEELVAAHHADAELRDIRRWERERPAFKAEVQRARSELGLMASGRVVRASADTWNAAAFVAAQTAADVHLARLRELTTDAEPAQVD